MGYYLNGPFPFSLFFSSSSQRISTASINSSTALPGSRLASCQEAAASVQVAGPAVTAAGSLRDKAQSVKTLVACTSRTTTSTIVALRSTATNPTTTMNQYNLLRIPVSILL
jgi:hypothetical protein